MTRVLVIEDEPDVAHAVAEILKDEGFEVAIAYDGSSGLAMFRELQPDLVILDLILPGVHGYTLLKAIRKDASVPVVILTGKTEEVDRSVGLAMGANDYVTKPFSIAQLLTSVRRVLSAAEGE